MSEACEGEYTQFSELIPLQQKHCEILSYIDEFCSENEITWSLAYGSVLGAARHGGPIPWDDDADIYMTALDYEKFRALFMEKGDHERFYLQETDSVDGMVCMPKLRMNGTTFIEDSVQNLDMHHGIYVDIFLLHECPATAWGRTKGKAAVCYLILKRLSNHKYNKRKILVPFMKFLALFGSKAGLKTAYKQLYQWDKHPSCKIADWENYAASPRWFIDRDVFFPVRRVDYNGHKFCVPNQMEKYLTITYGDWKTIPDLNTITWHQHSQNWSTTQDFRETMHNIKDFSDER